MRERPKSGRRALSTAEKLLIGVLCLCVFAAALLLSMHRMPDAETPSAGTETAGEEAALTLRLFPAATPAPLRTDDPFSGWQYDGEDYYYLESDGRMATGLRRIDGRLWYFLPTGVLAHALGVDVSYYNEDIDWAAVADQGIDFAIVRLGGRGWGGGVLYSDTRAVQYLHNAREAGLRVGAYFYSTAGSEREAAEEARAALRCLSGTPLDLPVFIDVEESGEYPDGRADRLTKDERTRVIEGFCRVIEAAGYEAGVYSGQYFYNSSLHVPALRGRMLWLANYTDSSRNRVPRFEAGYAIWQFTERGQVKGIRGYTDLNVVF